MNGVGTTGIRVGVTTWEHTRALRHAVLRPGLPLGVLDSPDDARSLDVAAWDGERVVGCTRVLPAPFAGEPAEPAAWQLRSMAVDPAYQGRGIGRIVLDEAVAVARDAGAPLLWANARTSALGFYLKAGWTAQGEEFEHGPTRLPHYLITLPLQAAG